MTGKIEGCREPEPGRHVELPAPPGPKRRNRLHRALKRLGVERLPVPNAAEIRQIVRHRPQPGDRSRHRPPPEERDAVHRAQLPPEHQCESHDPEHQNQRPVGGEESHQPSRVMLQRQSPPGGKDLHHDLIPINSSTKPYESIGSSTLFHEKI